MLFLGEKKEMLKHAKTIPKAPYVLSVNVPKKHAKTDKQNRNNTKGSLSLFILHVLGATKVFRSSFS